MEIAIPQGLTYQQKARHLVYAYAIDTFDVTDTYPEFRIDQVYIVWFCKTLQNWKALVSTTLPDQRYYEVTYNGDLKETYIDVYTKVINVKVPDQP